MENGNYLVKASISNNFIFIGDTKLVFPFYLHPSFFLQRNEAGNSTLMEFMAFQHDMDFSLAYGLLINTFISERHSTIASHMKNVLTNIVHYFDIWHLKKSKDIPVFTITVDCIILHYASINSGCNHRPASRMGQLQGICTHCQSWGSGISLNQCERPGH